MLATPKNISYLWGFGRFLGIVIVIQVVTGVLLAFYYVRGELAWASVIDLTREVRGGWLLRVVHGNTASFVFLVLFAHFIRALVQGSFYLSLPWLSGWLIIVLTIIAAFLGYVLPWGQMSFWGATVIINLLRVLPIGKTLVIWLWGGFYVSNFTCSFFYAVHYLVPLIVLILAGVHLLLLHRTGSSVPVRLPNNNALKIKFLHLFSYKDIVNFMILWGMWLLLLRSPDWSADPVNFLVSDLSNSPLHIQPEWYFLHLYAILRSIPNKIGGLFAFILALVLLVVFGFLSSLQKIRYLNTYGFAIWTFLRRNALLIWLGIQPVEDPYILIGQTMSLVYFYFIGYVLYKDSYAHSIIIWGPHIRIANSNPSPPRNIVYYSTSDFHSLGFFLNS